MLQSQKSILSFFKDKSVKVVALNENELKETQGAWWLNFVIGGTLGFATYAYNNWGHMTFGGALKSVGYGVISGYGVGVLGLRVLGIYKKTGGFGIAIGRPFIWNPKKWYGNKYQFGRIDFHRNSHDPYIHTHRGKWLR